MQYSIMFFSADTREGRPYQLLTDACRFADRHGFVAVWTPERHFHEFGGAYANPAVTSAAVSMITDRIQVRSGSLISPLHDEIRIAEEWAMVDNLSNGRIGISFGSGWNINDFVFFPERYEQRQAVMYRQIDVIRALWRGEPVVRKNSAGKEIEIRLFPRPVSKTLPLWVTSSGNVETFRSAGRVGANVLTHLIGQDLATLQQKISAYRQARKEAGLDPAAGCVTLMLHTFVGQHLDEVRETVRPHFTRYLRSAVSLEQLAAIGGGAISGGHKIEHEEIEPELLDELLELAFERYFANASLMGTPSMCRAFAARLATVGVDEIACLLDFGPTHQQVLNSLTQVAALVDSTVRQDALAAV
jgi:natural product biosynthesis luciferase-like monooxygenase protein